MKVSNDGRGDGETASVAEAEKRRVERARRREADARGFRDVVQRGAGRVVDGADADAGKENATTEAQRGHRAMKHSEANAGKEESAEAGAGAEVRAGTEAGAITSRGATTSANRNTDAELSADSDSGAGARAIADNEKGAGAVDRNGGQLDGDASSMTNGGDAGAGGDDRSNDSPLESQAASEFLNARLRPAEFALPASIAARERRPWAELVVDGIVRAVRFGHFQRRFDVRIELRAGVLGALSFHVTSDGGRLSLAFESENESALDAIRAKFDDLAAGLESAGIRFAAVDYRRRVRGALRRDSGSANR
ncbi:MAG: flagellar hook-length control protein FliK [Deltaproteobacteria bacterium]|nr:flagellar hook-length control protein FliK [Deltaproteobacteria bacterium]